MIGLRKLRLVSADARGGGTRDESLRESAGEANVNLTQRSCLIDNTKNHSRDNYLKAPFTWSKNI